MASFANNHKMDTFTNSVIPLDPLVVLVFGFARECEITIA